MRLTAKRTKGRVSAIPRRNRSEPLANLLYNERSPSNLGKDSNVFEDHLVRCDEDVELCNVVLPEFDSRRLGDELLRVVELVLHEKVSRIGGSVIKHNVNVGSPRSEFALPLPDERQWSNDQERALHLRGGLGLKLSQEGDSLNGFTAAE